jgi:hypothetical protein
MFMYNTATTSDITPGVYYNDGTKWIRKSLIINTNRMPNEGDVLMWNSITRQWEEPRPEADGVVGNEVNPQFRP